MEIYLNSEKLDIKNISITDFNKRTQEIKDEFSKSQLDFSEIQYLKGNKEMLEKSFQQQKAESLNL
jgi:glycyl-tRNA synthetase alpha subunit